VLQIVMESPEGKIRLNELSRRTQWLGRRTRSEFLDELKEMGLIDIVTETTSGRPATWVTFVKN
jgi:chromosome segregation and condensation protein ScpB